MCETRAAHPWGVLAADRSVSAQRDELRLEAGERAGIVVLPSRRDVGHEQVVRRIRLGDRRRAQERGQLPPEACKQARIMAV